jgi:ATP-dependent RNA helicase DeaD
MTTEFSVFQLHPQLVQAVTELGYSQPTPIQSAIIPLMLSRLDVIGQAQTGTGKTAAFALPILHQLNITQTKIQSLILTPTRELALQVTGAIEEYGRYSKPRVLAVYGGQPYHRQISRLKKGVDIVVGTPGRILDLIRQKALDLGEIQTVVLDEADEMLSMGFIEDIEMILRETPETRQTALFSATMPPAVRRLADRYLREPQFIAIQRDQPAVAAIEQRYYLVNEADKLAALTRLFEVEPVTSALIFVRTRLASSTLAGELTQRGFPAEVLNGDLPQETREGVMRRFRSNQNKVLVATDVAARGLDVDDISHVFNYDLPDSEEVYVHRIGRTGRAGKSGIAITLVTPNERWHLRHIEAFTHQKLMRAALPSEEDILNNREEALLAQMNVWLQRSRFRRERELVAKLVEEGNDPLEVAAAALKIARADEKQRPIAPLSEVQETPSRNSQRGARINKRRSDLVKGNISHEPGMVRLTISKGRSHGVRPNDVVSTIAFHAGVPGHSIGKIHIHDRHTLVDVPEDYLAQVLAKSEKYRIRKQPVTVEVA